MSSADLDETGCVAADLACLQCGYNLRSLAAAGRCPECGLPVARTLEGDSLYHADARWVQHLAIGAGGLAFGCLFLLIGIGLFALMVNVFAVVLLFDEQGWWSLVYTCSAMPLVGVLLIVAGAERLTRCEPRTWKRSGGRRLRIACRIALGIILVTYGVVLDVGWMVNAEAPRDIYRCWLGISAVVALITPALVLFMLAELLKRTDRKTWGVLARGLVVLNVAVALFAFLAVYPEIGTTWGPTLAESLHLALFWSLVPFTLGGVFLFFGACCEFSRAAKAPREKT